MAKHKQPANLFPSQTAVMPEGYYSGDKPNPNLRAFVESRLREGPNDPGTDDCEKDRFSVAAPAGRDSRLVEPALQNNRARLPVLWVTSSGINPPNAILERNEGFADLIAQRERLRSDVLCR